MRFAYADPPYFGLAAKFYGEMHADAAAYDKLETHAALIAKLCGEFPDGWAMSLQTPALRHILPLCPDDVRIGAWVKPFCAFKVNVNPAYAWEPVIFRGGRKRTREQETARDWVSEVITLKRGLVGAKPVKFCYWIFEFLNMTPGDEFHDLFPGSGAVTQAWENWKRHMQLPLSV